MKPTRWLLLALAAASACGGGGGGGAKSAADDETFPDEGRVAAANEKWCAALEKMGEQGRWSYAKECAAATPTASANFLERLSTCFARQLEELGDQAPDGHSMLQACTDEILYDTEPGDLSGNVLVRVRCERTERCEKSPADECRAAFERLEPAQRGLFVSMYNLRAQQEIARCLEETACATDEDGARGACYQAAYDKRVWTPF